MREGLFLINRKTDNTLQKTGVMKMKKMIVMLFVAATAFGAAPYTDLVPKYNRLTSNVMARTIEVPTMAHLDYTAYTANPVLAEQERPKFKKPTAPVVLDSITFCGKICDVKDRLNQTPLSCGEQQLPLAWRPLVKKLWNVVKDRTFPIVGGAINSYKWADASVYQPYQEVAAAYIHGSGDSVQVWLKIEFSPWVDFLPAVDDEDKDGIKEIYGKLIPGTVPRDSLKKAVAWMRGDYSQRILDRQEMIDWVTDLASYWYPTKNTDVVDMEGKTEWPDNRTEKSVVKTLGGVVIKNPLAVVKGKPFDPKKPIYNVYVVETADTAAQQKTVDTVVKQTGLVSADTARSKNARENDARFVQEKKQYGDYTVWDGKNGPFRKALAAYIAKLPAQQMAFAAKDGWLFFRKSVDYMVCGDLEKQAPDKNPMPPVVAFNEYLKKHGVNMLFVPVPCKEEVYFDKLPADVGTPAVPMLNPYGRKFLADLQADGVEVIDLLPLFLSAKEQDKQAAETLYQQHDTHWTTRGLSIAAAAIAKRIKSYQWYGGLPKTTFTVVDTMVNRLGDLVDKLPESERPAYEASTIRAQQVRMPDGKPYLGSKESPVMLIGDSFTGQFEYIDCKSAGVGAHIAANTGVGVEIITSWGGGPLVRKKAMAARERYLPLKKLVIYMMADRDLYNYKMGWEKFPEK